MKLVLQGTQKGTRRARHGRTKVDHNSITIGRQECLETWREENSLSRVKSRNFRAALCSNDDVMSTAAEWLRYCPIEELLSFCPTFDAGDACV